MVGWLYPLRVDTHLSLHEAVLLAHNGKRNQRDAILEDIQKHIIRWQEEGDLIILGMDTNENIDRGPAAFARQCKLIPVLQLVHPDLPMTATCNKNRQEIAVDGIWSSPSLEITQCGMAGFGEMQVGKTDHRILWLDISVFSAFGYQPPSPAYKQPNRLSLNNPTCIKRYNEEVKRLHEKEGTTNRLIHIIRKFNDSKDKSITQQSFDVIVKKDFVIRAQARRRCRKLCMGKKPFSDELQTYHQRIHMWNLIIATRKGQRVDSRKIIIIGVIFILRILV